MNINEIWAYISEDEDGNEGLCGFQDPNLPFLKLSIFKPPVKNSLE